MIQGAGFPHSSVALELAPRNIKDPNGYYEILGVDPWASHDEIRAVIRREIKIYHPDGTNPDPTALIWLLQVSAVLLDPVRRAEYNRIPPGSIYLGQIELQQLRGKLKDLSKIFSKAIDKPEFWSYNGRESERDFAQGWYEVLLAALYANQMNRKIIVHIQDIETPRVQNRKETLSAFIPRKLEPDYFIALRLVSIRR